MTLEQKLNAMAEALVDEASHATTDLVTKEKVDIFKATSAWYLGMRKAMKGVTDDADAEGTFSALRERVNGKGTTQ